MKVAIVTQGLHAGGGIPTTVEWLVKALSSNGIDTHIHDLAVSSSDHLSRSLRRPSTWTRRTLAQTTSGLTHWGANAVELEFMRYLPRRQLTRALDEFDVVHVVSGGPALGLAARRARSPLVIQMATFAEWERDFPAQSRRSIVDYWRRFSTLITTRVEAAAISEADHVLVMNDVVYSHLHQNFPSTKVMLLPPGVDTARFTPNHIRTTPPHLLSVARLAEPRKGFPRLFKAYAQFRNVHPDPPSLVLAGRGPAPDELRALIGHLGLTDHVRIVEDASETDLLELYLGSGAFLQASYEEGLGIAVLEAMACGIPVIATDTAGTRETMIDGVTGYIVQQGADEDVAEAMARAISIALQNGDVLGRAARAHVIDHFSSKKQSARLVEVYRSLVAQRAGGS